MNNELFIYYSDEWIIDKWNNETTNNQTILFNNELLNKTKHNIIIYFNVYSLRDRLSIENTLREEISIKLLNKI